jgi:hypothetical protein
MYVARGTKYCIAQPLPFKLDFNLLLQPCNHFTWTISSHSCKIQKKSTILACLFDIKNCEGKLDGWNHNFPLNAQFSSLGSEQKKDSITELLQQLCDEKEQTRQKIHRFRRLLGKWPHWNALQLWTRRCVLVSIMCSWCACQVLSGDSLRGYIYGQGEIFLAESCSPPFPPRRWVH